MKVDALHPDQRRKGSVRIHVGGKPAWTVPASTLSELGITVGSQLSLDMTTRLDQAADVEGALRAGLRMLERRAHGKRELGRKLLCKGHGHTATASALDRLLELGLLDDAEFARGYVESRAGRGRGPARLRRDLSHLGVAPEHITRAVATLEAEEAPDPWKLALEQAKRRAAGMGGLKRDARQRRLLNFFARRGFSGEEVREVVEELVGPVLTAKR